MAHPSQPLLPNIKTQANYNSYLYYSHMQIELIISSTPTQPGHPTTSFLVLLIIASLVLSSIYTTFDFTTDPTLIYVLIHSFYFIPFLIVTTGELMVELGWVSFYIFQYQIAIVLLIFFCVKSNLKKTETNKKPPGR